MDLAGERVGKYLEAHATAPMRGSRSRDYGPLQPFAARDRVKARLASGEN